MFDTLLMSYSFTEIRLTIECIQFWIIYHFDFLDFPKELDFTILVNLIFEVKSLVKVETKY